MVRFYVIGSWLYRIFYLFYLYFKTDFLFSFRLYLKDSLITFQ